MSQIMKAVLAMEYREIPPTIGIENFNPTSDFDGAKVRVVTEMTPWPSNLLRRVSINRYEHFQLSISVHFLIVISASDMEVPMHTAY
jgi:hypothetical protein